MKRVISLMLAFSLAFSQTVVVPIPGQREQEPQQDGGNGNGQDLGALIGILVGVGVILILSKTVLSKASEQDVYPFVPFQFIAVYKGELPPDVEPAESLKVEDLNFSLIEWKEEEKELRKKLEGKVLLLQPNYIYEVMGKAESVKGPGRLDSGRHLVAVLDTGADYELLKDILLYTRNMRPEPYKAELHGTAVAYLAHRASGAKVVLYRVCSQGRCDSWSIIKALADILRRDIRVVNMSFGTQKTDRAVELLIKLLSAKGVKVTAPAGNRPAQELPFPARIEEVISVAGAPCYPEKVCVKAKVREPYEFELPFGRFRGTSFSSAFHAGKLVRDF